ncbi:hypothetical protein FQR65_LT03680 [Abscondita terminalis]|nr:hypothetical protein FQR65_LT03680 [Abscondita terminalis]
MDEIQRQTKPKETVIVRTLLGYEINSYQYVIFNYLVPSILSCLLYIVHFACDFAVSYRHFYEKNPIWGSMSILFMFLPSLSCYILTISSLELWPKFEGCGNENIRWCLIKTLQHVFFPVWSMWRHAEKIFWSIEGMRTIDDKERDDIIEKISAPRTVELYYFFQGYLQAAPQILFQLHVLMRYTSEVDTDTVNAQVLSVIFSIAQMAKTTTLFQRFKSQNVGGKSYPWFKSYKVMPTKPDHQRKIEPTPPIDVPDFNRSDSRGSSECYEEPIGLFHKTSTKDADYGRETSIVDGPRRLILRSSDDETDIPKPRRLTDVKALPEDDVAAKSISFIWWFLFLLGRMLAISSFSYFYETEIIWILSSHFIIVVALLLYDVRHDEVRRAKAIFFAFIGFVYLFCLIEFKIIFKKPKFIYNGFFALMFLENFTMVLIWWSRNMEDIMNDWWYKYMFYTIIGCSILSLLSILLYLNVLKPKKVVIDTVPYS